MQYERTMAKVHANALRHRCMWMSHGTNSYEWVKVQVLDHVDIPHLALCAILHSVVAGCDVQCSPYRTSIPPPLLPLSPLSVCWGIHTQIRTVAHRCTCSHVHTRAHTPVSRDTQVHARVVQVCMYTNTYTHTDSHAHMHTSTHAHIHTRTHAHTRAQKYKYSHARTHANTRTNTNTNACTRTHAYIHSFSRARALSLSLSFSLSLSLSLSHTHTHTNIHTHTHPLTRTLAQQMGERRISVVDLRLMPTAPRELGHALLFVEVLFQLHAYTHARKLISPLPRFCVHTCTHTQR